jgi:hypothetical protein
LAKRCEALTVTVWELNEAKHAVYGVEFEPRVTLTVQFMLCIWAWEKLSLPAVTGR